MTELPFASVDELQAGLASTPTSPTGGSPRRSTFALARQAAPARGRGRRRQDRGGEDPRDAPGPPPDPAPVLRRDRRLPGALRVELLAPADRRSRDGRDRRREPRRGPVRPRVPGRAPAPGRDPRRRRGAARGRARPRRRRVRGVPARDPLGVRGDDPRGRAGRARDPAGGGRHVEPHARAARRAQAPVPLPLDRSPGSGARGGDRAHPRPARQRVARARRRLAVERLREMDLAKFPGVAETIDWANALAFLGADALDRRSRPTRWAPS